MIEIKINEEELKSLYLAELNKRLDKIEQEAYLMNSKQLCKMLSLSWPTIEKIFISDPDFPSMRVGSKWVFHRKRIESYIDNWSWKQQAKNP